jgi:hypothetical protein
MKRIAVIVLGLLTVSTGAFAQATQEAIDKAVLPAPRNAKEGATVIKWNKDFTYETLRKGTNRWVCYDRSGDPGEQPFAVQCTSLGNLERVAQNRKFEAERDPKKRQALIAEAEANGTRVKPEYGSAFISMDGADQATARSHITIAVPGATTQSTGLPDNNKQGGAWIMDAGTTTAHIMVPGH